MDFKYPFLLQHIGTSFQEPNVIQVWNQEQPSPLSKALVNPE
jgi:hypothetical protein